MDDFDMRLCNPSPGSNRGASRDLDFGANGGILACIRRTRVDQIPEHVARNCDVNFRRLC